VGDQVSVAVSGTLHYVPYKEFERVRSLSVEAVVKTTLFAALCRINTLYMIARAGSGHIGSSFSSIDIMSWLQLNELRTAAPNDQNSPNDIFFSSKGHDAPALYNTWIGLGKLEFDLIHQLRRLNGLPGHPDVSTPHVVTNTGSLGMGVSKAKGMIFANRLQKKSGNVYVLTGDGELQEGQFWESLISAANQKLRELTVIIDHNKHQSDTLVSKVSDLGDLEAKLSAFGWHVSRCDGNDLGVFSKTIAATKRVSDKPKFIIADTIKGKGVSFMEHTSIDSDVEFYKFHSGAPTDEAYIRAAQELIDTANAKLAAVKASALELETIIRPAAAQPDNPQRLIQVYSNTLLEQARGNSRIVALDADLILDTGLIPFKTEFPDRFLECGIAEQDMVSVAGGIALSGLLPIVHSFSCFLSSRPNEQIYNNATERTKVVYVGSLAGVIPAGPGHSHQAVRDISALAAVPGLVMMEPSCGHEVEALLDWALNVTETSSYLRLVSAAVELPFSMPRYNPVLGRGIAINSGGDVAVISHGPAMLSVAVEAARSLGACEGISVKVINLPWLNCIDSEWLLSEVAGIEHIFSLEDHYRVGGQADRLAGVFAGAAARCHALHSISIGRIPSCGSNFEVLADLQLDRASVRDRIKRSLSISSQ
jgi:transketolase